MAILIVLLPRCAYAALMNGNSPYSATVSDGFSAHCLRVRLHRLRTFTGLLINTYRRLARLSPAWFSDFGSRRLLLPGERDVRRLRHYLLAGGVSEGTGANGRALTAAFLRMLLYLLWTYLTFMSFSPAVAMEGRCSEKRRTLCSSAKTLAPSFLQNNQRDGQSAAGTRIG